MSGDPFRKTVAGEPFRPKSAAWNAMLDAAQAHRSRQQSLGAAGGLGLAETNIILVKNNAAAAIPRFGIAGITGFVISPADNLIEFQRAPALTVTKPVGGTHDTRWVVCLAPLAPNAVGPALAFGASIVALNITDTGHKFAKVVGGECYLESAATGPAEILYAPSATGQSWAFIRFGGGAGESPGNAPYQVRVWDNTAQAWGPGWVRAHG